MQFIVHQEIFDRFPGLNLPVVVAHSIGNQAGRSQVEEDWRKTWADAAKAAVYGNAQSHPHVQPWRERFREQGSRANNSQAPLRLY